MMTGDLSAVTLSHSKTVYVLSQCKLSRLKKIGSARCTKCQCDFNLDDIVATSTSKRYCYECAVKINLVTGKIIKDLGNDEFLLDVTDYVDSIGRKLEVGTPILKLAALLVSTAICNKHYVSKNKIGLACAAIFLACQIENQPILDDGAFPVSKKMLQMNSDLLQKNLINTDVFTLSKFIHGSELRN